MIQKDIAGILTLKAGEIVPGKIVSVTNVRITPDLSIARVYLSFFPSDNQEEDIKAMQANTVRSVLNWDKKSGRNCALFQNWFFILTIARII